MNISRENEGKVSTFIKIELTKDDYRESVNKSLKSYQQKAQIKGFRQGKIPFGLVEKMYGKSILTEEINKIVTDALINHIEENKLKILGQPIAAADKGNEGDFDQADRFVFWFELGLSPEFTIDLKAVCAKKYEIEISDEMVDNYIKAMERRFGKVESPETTEEKDLLGGQMIELDETGEPKEGGVKTTSSISIDLIALKTTQKKFIDKKVGDFIDFTLLKAFKNISDVSAMMHLSKDEVEKLAPEFRFVIDSITRVEPAELNEELFKKVYPSENITTIEAFREQVRKEAAQYYEKETEKQFSNEVADALIANTEFEMPDKFLKRWIREQEGIDQMTDEVFHTEYENYGKSLRWQLIESQLMEENNIKVDPQEVKDFYRRSVLSNYFSGEQADEETSQKIDLFVDSMMQNKEEVKRVYEMLLTNKLNDLFKGAVKIKIEKISLEAFTEILNQESQKNK